MPARVSAWSIYAVFSTADDQKVFVGVISEKHWAKLCTAFGWTDWLADDRLATNNQRIAERDWFLPAVAGRFAQLPQQEIISKCETAGVPFAPIATPEDLFTDPQLNQGGNLVPVQLPDGSTVPLPNTPLQFGDERAEKYHDPPTIGEHTTEILTRLGYAAPAIAALAAQSIIRLK